MRREHPLAWAIGIALGALLPGLGALPAAAQTVERPVANERNPPGDIPDSQVFITYKSPLGFMIKVPEGWSRTDRKAGVQFADKYGVIDIAIEARSEPVTVATVRDADVKVIEQSGRAVVIGSVKSVHVPAGPAVLVKYTANSALNAVTGKQIRMEHDRYLIAQPMAASHLRLPSQSESAPENTLTIIAVASATPSMKPTVTFEAPSTLTR